MAPDLFQLDDDVDDFVPGQQVLEHLELFQTLCQRRTEAVALLAGVIDRPDPRMICAGIEAQLKTGRVFQW